MDVVFSIDKCDYATTSLYRLKDTSKQFIYKQQLKPDYVERTIYINLIQKMLSSLGL